MDNENNGNGGGVYIDQWSAPWILNCVFMNNTADKGGAIYHNGNNFNVYNCSFVGNSASSNGNAFYFEKGGVSLNSSIICDNSGNAPEAVSFNGIGTFIVEYCNFNTNGTNFGGASIPADLGLITTVNSMGTPSDGNYNIFTDPLFIDATDYNLRLLRGSRCIDAGDPNRPYVNEPEPNGDCINIGACGNTVLAAQSRVFKSIPRNEYFLAGIPVFASDGDASYLFAEDFLNTSPGNPNWRVSRWDVEYGKYVRYQEPDHPGYGPDMEPPDFAPGLGYWIIQDVDDGVVIDFEEEQIDGGAVFQNDYHPVALQKPQNSHAGMNMLANPYPYLYDWRETQVTDGVDTLSLTEAALADWIMGYAAGWDHEVRNYKYFNFDPSATEDYLLSNWEGIIFQQFVDDKDLTILYTPRSIWTEEPPVPQSVTQDNWALKLIVETADGQYQDRYNFLGVNESASEDFDILDCIEYTPISDKFVQLYFPHSDWEEGFDYFTYDYRSNEFDSTKTWEFSVGTYNLSNQTIKLSWPNLSSISNEYSFRLEDLTDGSIIENLRELEDYQFQNGSSSSTGMHDFLITVSYTPDGENPDDLIPDKFGITSAYPNPFNPETNIAFNILETGKTSLKVYDVLGREIATLIEGTMSTGIHTVSWNPTESASGIYFLRLESRREISVRKVVLLK